MMMMTLLRLFLLVVGTTTTTTTNAYSLLSPLFQNPSSSTITTTTITTTIWPTIMRQHHQQRRLTFQRKAILFQSSSSSSSTSADLSSNNNDIEQHWNNNNNIATSRAFDTTVKNRFACKTFLRFDQRQNATTTTTTNTTTTKSASISDPFIVARAVECLEIARLTPSAFNTQPYKVVLVHSPEQKLAISKYCLGPNAQRVLDSDCTVIFLADCKILQTLPRFGRFWASLNDRSLTLITKIYITLFSSGYPFLPRFISSILSFFVRTSVSILNIITSSVLFQYPLPTLTSSETWSCKQTTMVAMTYMLACSSRGLATIPMEGINAGGIRSVIGASRRYAIPVIVSTGLPLLHEKTKNKNDDDGKQRRYPLNEMVFGDSFNQRMQITGTTTATAATAA